MPTNYMGTPLESDWEKLQQRRAINNAIVQQSMAPYRGTESAVGGRSVDNRWGSGISKIGQALVGAYGNKKLREDSAALGEKYDTGRTAAMEEVMEALREQGNAGPYGPQVPKKSDPKKAAMKLLNPYLQGNNDVARALINSEAYGNRGGRGAYSRVVESEDGRMYTINTRDPNAQPQALSDENGNPMFSPKSTPRALYNQGYSKTSGGNAAEVRPDTGKGAQADISARGKVRGEAGETAKVDFPATEYAANYLKDIATKLRDHPGMSDVIGVPNVLTGGGLVPGTKGADFREIYKQLEGGVFLQAYETLKGGGQITEIEGAKATAAKVRMGKAQTEKSFISALNEFISEVDKLTDIARRRAGLPQAETATSGAVDRAPLSADKEARFRERLKQEQAQ